MFLYINTSKNYIELVLLKIREKKIELIGRKVSKRKTEDLLIVLENLLLTKIKKINQIKGIFVITGEGGHTSLRIGAIIANTLAYSLNVAVRKIENKNNLNWRKLVEKNLKNKKL